MDIKDWADNLYADKLAAKEADLIEATNNEAATFLNDREQIKHMQERAMTAHGMALEQSLAKDRGPKQEMAPVIQRMPETAGHDLEWCDNGRRVTCRLCHQTVPYARFRPWLRAGKCPGNRLCTCRVITKR